MNKKLLLTTALVSMLAASAHAQVTIKGHIETTFGDHETASTSTTSYEGAAIGQETMIEFNHTKDLVGGWKSSLDMEIMEVAATVADTEIKISNGATSFFISKDGGSIMDVNAAPGAYNARPTDNIEIGTARDTSNGTIHGVQNFGFAQDIAGFGKVELRYAPDMTTANTAGDKNTGAGGGSGMEYGFIGNMGVDGLTVHLAQAVTKNVVDTTNNDVKNTHYGVGYNFGQFSAGVSRNNEDGATANSDQVTTLYGVTFSPNKSTTLGVNYQTHEADGTTSDEEILQFEAAYNLGGATVAIAYQQAENVNNARGSDADGFMVTYKQAF